MNKTDTLAFLTESGISFELTEHQAVFNMEELKEVKLPYPEADAKNLFVRDDKKRQYYLITVKGDKRVDLKDFRKQNGTRPLTFASAEDLLELMHLTPGSVTPLGLLNDETKKVIFYLDKWFLTGAGRIGCHPNDNTATVWMQAEDLIRILKEHGTAVNVVEIG